MAQRVGIVGASGYGGAELARLLGGHPALELATLGAHSSAGEPVAGLYPNLAEARRFDPIDIGALTELDLVFLATPHAAAIELGGALYDAGTKVVDLSAAFRLGADEFTQWYGQEHPRPDLLDGAAVYGLTEYARDAVAGATLVANPGCYVTTALLGLLPLAGMLDPTSIVIDGKSGTSGAGRGVSDTLHFAHVDGSVTAYGAPSHRHTGEIERYLRVLGGLDVPAVSFTPHLVPMTRGLLITAYARLTPGASQDDVTAALHERYAGEPFVRVLPPGTFPATKAVHGSNGCQVSAIVDPRTDRVVVTCVTDNLGKGAAGQALQNANLMLGLEESLGLTAIGVYP
ncbi:MAG TPA: N-acetyl-gamma-glutamyl-phosphate reductase [Nitriliruptorales bacterium]